MFYFENAEQHPKFSENITCSASNCGKVITSKQPIYECSFCGKCYHPHCRGIVGQHITRKALDPYWFCSDLCDKSGSDKVKQTNIKPKNPNLAEIISKLNQYDGEFGEIKLLITEIKKSQEFICNEFDNLRAQYQKVVENNKDLVHLIKKMKEENVEQRGHINQLETNLDNIQQQSLQSNLIISGLPSEDIEPGKLVNNIFNLLECDDSINDVVRISYMKQKINNNAAMDKIDKKLVITFKTPESKNKVQVKKKHKMMFANQIGYSVPVDRQIFFRDHLTVFRLRLYRQCVKLKKLINYKFLWINSSVIYFRKEEGARVIRILSQNDIDKILAAHNIDPNLLK